MTAPIILWFRRDLRLHDHPALAGAIEAGAPVVPLFILSPEFEAMGAAARWRLAQSLAALSAELAAAGSRLVLRRGAPDAVLDAVIAETGAAAVHWSRLYDRESRERDARIKADLKARGIAARSFNAALLFEPWEVQTGSGGFFKVYSPFWRAVKDRPVPAPLAAPTRVPAPAAWPAGETLEAWALGADMRRGAAVVARHFRPGAAAALDRLAAFLDGPIDSYKARRDFPAANATSGLSEYLTYGEISPRQAWHGGWRQMQQGSAGAEHFLKELVWREFAWHLMYHSPDMATRNWREGWDAFPWRGDNDQAEAWRRGRTGVPFVDAAMREMYVTGRMHNRARMVAASYLTKHLLTDWRVGLAWFADCLTDWDAASNAMGWQWVAGSGPDAAPYFRIFNPETQAEKFDPDGAYRHRWIAEGRRQPHADALSYFDAVPLSWNMSPDDAYPAPIVDLAEGRRRALEALERSKGH